MGSLLGKRSLCLKRSGPWNVPSQSDELLSKKRQKSGGFSRFRSETVFVRKGFLGNSPEKRIAKNSLKTCMSTDLRSRKSGYGLLLGCRSGLDIGFYYIAGAKKKIFWRCRKKKNFLGGEKKKKKKKKKK